MGRLRAAFTSPSSHGRARATGVVAATVLLALAFQLLVAQPAPASSLGAGYQWYWLNPSPQGNAIQAIDFAGVASGWAVGDAGTILTTTDRGATWKRQTSGTASWLTGVSFPTTLQGWAVGSDGLILHTADGGKHWAPQASGSMDPLWDVAFADAKHGWAVGGSWSNPVLLATTDGGLHWAPQTSPTANQLGAVDCVDAQHAWAVGDGGALMFTSDGGANWEFRYLNGSSSPSFRGVDFSDALHGWAVDYNGQVAATADGGDTWHEVSQDVASWGLSDVATNGVRVWVTAPDGLILSRDTSAAGVWESEASGLTADLYGVATSGAGAIIGGYGGALATTSGDGAWAARWSGIDADFQGVAFADKQHGWVAGQKSGGDSTALIYATSDGGRTWTKQLEDDGMNWLGDLAMLDSQHGWAVGWGGCVAVTSDGSTWTTLVPPAWPATNYYGVAAGDAQHVVAVGYPGNGKNLTVTTDGGATWPSPASGVTATLQDVTFGDATHAWAVGDGGAITASSDAGASWMPQTSGTGSDLQAVDFVDSLTGWAAGSDGVIVHTVDGGANWTPQSSGTASRIASIQFLTAQKGWAVTGDGEILETADGGASWGNAGVRCGGALNDVAVVDATHAFAVGGCGGMLALDVVKPTVSAKAPKTAQHTKATVRFTAADAQSGVALVQYRLGSGAWRSGTSAKVTRLGTTVVSYRAADAAGNVSAVKKVTVRVIQ